MPSIVILSSRKNRMITLIPATLKEAYLKAYRVIIHPMNGQTMWEKTNLTAIKPPTYYKQHGRAKKDEEERAF